MTELVTLSLALWKILISFVEVIVTFASWWGDCLVADPFTTLAITIVLLAVVVALLSAGGK